MSNAIEADVSTPFWQIPHPELNPALRVTCQQSATMGAARMGTASEWGGGQGKLEMTDAEEKSDDPA